MNHLLHQELIERIPLVGGMAAQALNQRAEEAAADNCLPDPNVTVAIRTRNEALQLEGLLQDIAQQVVAGEVQVVVVDNESSDHTKSIAKEYGAEVVTLPRDEFTYPSSMNLAMHAASHDAVFLTVAHARLTTSQTLHAGTRHFRDSAVGGVFSVVLPSETASRAERVGSIMNAFELFRQPRKVTKAGMGVMAATGAFFAKNVWDELGRFDERYKTGGEDTALARAMLSEGYAVVKEPALAVHHAHGLGVVDSAKELHHFAKTLRAPQPLEGDIWQRRRARFENLSE